MQNSIYPELSAFIFNILNYILLFVVFFILFSFSQKIPSFLKFIGILKNKNKLKVLSKSIKQIPFFGATLSSKIIICILALIALFLLGISFFVPNSLTIYPLDWSQSSNFATSVDGLMSPFIAIAAAILTFMAFWVQYNANQNIHRENKKQQDERQFYEMLKIHRDNVDKMEFVYFSSEKESLYGRVSSRVARYWKKDHELIHSKSQSAIRFFLKEFRCIYNVVKPLHIDSDEKFRISYKVFFEGLECSHEYCNNFNVDRLFCEKKEQVNNAETDGVPRSSIMEGHRDVLNPYYRHLYLTVKSIVDSNFDYLEKVNYLNILRASLTAEEQVLLFFNWYYGKLMGEKRYGYKWQCKGQKYFTEWRMIHNIVKSDFDYVEELETFGKIAHKLDEKIAEDENKSKESLENLFEECKK